MYLVVGRNRSRRRWWRGSIKEKKKRADDSHEIPVELQASRLAHQVLHLRSEVRHETDVVLEDDTGGQLPLDDLRPQHNRVNY